MQPKTQNIGPPMQTAITPARDTIPHHEREVNWDNEHRVNVLDLRILHGLQYSASQAPVKNCTWSISTVFWILRMRPLDATWGGRRKKEKG